MELGAQVEWLELLPLRLDDPLILAYHHPIELRPLEFGFVEAPVAGREEPLGGPDRRARRARDQASPSSQLSDSGEPRWMQMSLRATACS
jgi:hypothetical protein